MSSTASSTPPRTAAISRRGSIREGQVRTLTFVKRLFGFPELRDWYTAAGFTAVAGYGEDGRPLHRDHNRMLVVAEH